MSDTPSARAPVDARRTTRWALLVAYALGALVALWVSAGYVRQPFALGMTLLIVVFYSVGALELRRAWQDTARLDGALALAAAPVQDLAAWLAAVPVSLRHAVRLRVEGERVGLPGPSMTPFLVGLLVLLGMLGTFLGMVATLGGTGAALEATTDLKAMRDALAAPVKGLGLAFGTSVVGVATSAMLGLMSALVRRDRQRAQAALDAAIATTLRPFGRAHQREAMLALMQQQAAQMPELLAQMPALLNQMQTELQGMTRSWLGEMQSLMTTVQSQARQSAEQLAAEQARFHAQAADSYQALAASVGTSLQASLGESARQVSATLQPVAEATMAGITRETAALHERIVEQVGRQIEGISTRFDERAAALVERVASSHLALQADLVGAADIVARESATLHERVAGSVGEQLSAVATRLDAAVAGVSTTWQGALAQQERNSEQLLQQVQRVQADAGAHFDRQSGALLGALAQSHEQLQTELAARDTQRLATWQQSLETMASSLQREWQQAGAASLSQQQQICQTLEATARSITAEAQAHARGTISEVSRLVTLAAEAPRAAAEVVAELREKLSDSMVRDQAMLEERNRLMGTLSTLLDAVQRASTEQRQAIDALVQSTTDGLALATTRFASQVDAEATRLDNVAAQLAGSAVEVASLGEAFGAAVQVFQQGSQQLVGHLERVDTALGQSMTRSDEQLAYYVAQAREVIDLSIMSQKQVVEDLQRMASQQRAAGTVATNAGPAA
ncbi:DUF802 domain-containing protein [Ideonella margarita]|uniref:DUF802 domain-containing protein n=1 Tax=Ideonella margarita TaxID=2984191 RepID=UPI003BF9E49E